MSYIGQQLPADVFSGFVTDSFTGDGSATTFTLSKAPFSEDALIVVINNVIQKPVTNFTVSGTTLTIVGTAVASSDVIYAMHTSGAVPITLASKVDVNGLSDGVILDADADTTISADTDDQIDIKIAGADDFQFTANTFTAQSGSTIAAQALTATTIGATGVVTANAGVVVDNITIDGTEIDLSSGDLTIDVAGDITIDADGGDFTFSDGGTTRIRINNNDGTTFVQPFSGYGIDNQITPSSGNVYGQKNTFENHSPDNNTSSFYWGNDNVTARFGVYSDGDVQNHDNSYGAFSDERIKQDIRDSNSQWDDIKAVKVRNFKKKDDVRQYGDKAWEQIGVIAQELEAAGMDKLIKHGDPSAADIISSSEFGTLYEDGDDIPEGKKIGDIKEIKAQVKKIGYSVLYMKAIKALQEAMAKIETLETKVKALEDA